MPDRRQVPRYIFNGAAQLSPISNGQTAEITLESISVTGCRTGSLVAPNSAQKGVLTIGWQGREFRAEVEIVWKSTKGGAGLRFLSIDKENLAILRDICRSHPLEPLTQASLEPDRTR